jgi:hypothetical protein
MEFLEKYDIEIPKPGSSKHDACINEMYSCGHSCKSASVASNVVGVVLTLSIIGYLIYRYMNRPKSGRSGLLAFTNGQDVFKIFIGLLMLVNIKTLSNSLIANIISPLVKPILPLLSCNLRIKVGLFDIGAGEFMSDLLVFSLNLYVIYFLFQAIF